RPLAADHARGDAPRARGGEARAARAGDHRRVTLDVFLESPGEFDRDAVEDAFAANGIGGDGSTVATADGGRADGTLEGNACGFLVEVLTPDLARIVFDVATRARLAILPVDGTPTALVVPGADADGELEPLRVGTPREVYDALRASVDRRDEARGARSA